MISFSWKITIVSTTSDVDPSGAEVAKNSEKKVHTMAADATSSYVVHHLVQANSHRRW